MAGQQRSHLVDVKARVLWFVPVAPKELMHFCVIDKAIVIFIVVAVVPASVALTFLDDNKTNQREKGVLVWAVEFLPGACQALCHSQQA